MAEEQDRRPEENDQLEGHADVVDQCHHANRRAHDQGGGDDREERDHNFSRRIELDLVGKNAGQDNVDDQADGGHDQDDGDQVEEARRPAHPFATEVFCPLVDATLERVVGAKLGPGQRHEQLEDKDQRDGPDERWATKGKGGARDQKRSGGRTLECDREKRAGYVPDRSFELRLDAELPQIDVILLACPGLGHGCSPPGRMAPPSSSASLSSTQCTHTKRNIDDCQHQLGCFRSILVPMRV